MSLETLSNSLRMSATKAVSKQRQGGWSSCFGRILRSQLLFRLAQECANHHPNCKKPRPDSGRKSAFTCQLERGLLFLCVKIISTVLYRLFSLEPPILPSKVGMGKKGYCGRKYISLSFHAAITNSFVT